ncbi:MAG: hypothetical protein ACE5IB_03525 [Candidatus Geothermarchaeales archaeon]
MSATLAAVLVLASVALSVTPVLAYTTKTKTKSLSIAGDVEFTSSFNGVSDDELMTIEIDPVDSSVTIDHVDLVKATPKPKQPGVEDCSSSNNQGDSIDVQCVFGDKKNLHLWVYLSTGEHIGVNVHS